jgi:hypothetical protein
LLCPPACPSIYLLPPPYTPISSFSPFLPRSPLPRPPPPTRP